jgi:hypothetical protein
MIGCADDLGERGAASATGVPLSADDLVSLRAAGVAPDAAGASACAAASAGAAASPRNPTVRQHHDIAGGRRGDRLEAGSFRTASQDACGTGDDDDPTLTDLDLAKHSSVPWNRGWRCAPVPQ